jgi:hypothetical protein
MKEASWTPLINAMDTEELKEVKDLVNHNLRRIIRKDTAEGIIKRREEELQELKERYANGGDIRIDIKEYNDGQAISKDQVVSILDDFNNKK